MARGKNTVGLALGSGATAIGQFLLVCSLGIANRETHVQRHLKEPNLPHVPVLSVRHDPMVPSTFSVRCYLTLTSPDDTMVQSSLAIMYLLPRIHNLLLLIRDI